MGVLHNAAEGTKESFGDLWGAIRKYVLPVGLGGGYTEEEKVNNTANLTEAEERAEGKTLADYIDDILEILGLKKASLWVVAVLAVVVIALFKD